METVKKTGKHRATPNSRYPIPRNYGRIYAALAEVSFQADGGEALYAWECIRLKTQSPFLNGLPAVITKGTSMSAWAARCFVSLRCGAARSLFCGLRFAFLLQPPPLLLSRTLSQLVFVIVVPEKSRDGDSVRHKWRTHRLKVALRLFVQWHTHQIREIHIASLA
jgi:hypothetical protein